MSETPGERPSVVLVGTLDTKGHEYAFLRDRIRACDVEVLLVDTGILGEPLTEPDVSRQEVRAVCDGALAEGRAYSSSVGRHSRRLTNENRRASSDQRRGGDQRSF